MASGLHSQLYNKLGAHICRHDSDAQVGTLFSVWAPAARGVSVLGDFNDWRHEATPMHRVEGGVWEVFVPSVKAGYKYKYQIHGCDGSRCDKSDPFSFAGEPYPNQALPLPAGAPRQCPTNNVVTDLHTYKWTDRKWMGGRKNVNHLEGPLSIYELHLGSFMRNPDESFRCLTYCELGKTLVPYILEMGFTHVEFMPVMEHPFYGSWGYQVTGYFAPTSRYGPPEGLMELIDMLHNAGVGVILDWVPAHFPLDEHALARFDGSPLYEYGDPRRGFHPDWKTGIFDYGRPEIRSFLLSSARFWLEHYHADGLRVDAVASMLYFSYSRKPGEWIANETGGQENWQSVNLLRQLNEVVHKEYDGVFTIAEESTTWPQVSGRKCTQTSREALGFDFKWDMGWMNDTLEYFRVETQHRSTCHNKLTFRNVYAHSENFIVPLSHDEVVHGKGSLLRKMPSDDWQRFANLRLLLGYQYGTPGKKLLFMGQEFGQWQEWSHDSSLDWHLLQDGQNHQGIKRWVAALNRAYAANKALHEADYMRYGFQWLDVDNSCDSVLIFLRRARSPHPPLIAAFNFTPTVRDKYRVRVPHRGPWRLLLNSDAQQFGGSDVHPLHGLEEVEAVETNMLRSHSWSPASSGWSAAYTPDRLQQNASTATFMNGNVSPHFRGYSPHSRAAEQYTLSLRLPPLACVMLSAAPTPTIPTVLRWAGGGENVSVSGSFNEWAERVDLTRDDSSLPDGPLGKPALWQVTMQLPPGVYEYKFIVDGAWHHDPEAPQCVESPHGNSLLTV